MLMNSLLQPVGPQPAAVYWRRRGVVVGGVLLVILILIMIWPSGGGSAPVAAPTATESAAASASASPTASGTGVVACADSDIDITTTVEPAEPVVGSSVRFVMSIKNISDRDCTRPVGTTDTSFTVSSGGYRVWSSDDCSPAGEAKTETIPKGQEYVLESTWPGVITEPGCSSTQLPAKAGSYEVVATDASASSSPTRFVLTKASGSASPSPSASAGR